MDLTGKQIATLREGPQKGFLNTQYLELFWTD